MKINVKYKAIISIAFIILMILIFIRYLKPMYEYPIQDSESAISKSICKLTGQPVDILLMEDVDNRRIVLFQRGSEIGESLLTKGTNNKYKLDSTGYGSNEVRYRILNTSKGQYVKFIGKSSTNISRILCFVDGERYDIEVPEGEEYFIAYKQLIKKTSSSFPSGSVWFDNKGEEIARVNISTEYIL